MEALRPRICGVAQSPNAFPAYSPSRVHNTIPGMTTAEVRARISEINALLASGARTVTLDGVTITYDFESLERERSNLLKQLPGGKPTRRSVFRVNLGNSE